MSGLYASIVDEARRAPDRLAVGFNGARLSYGQFARMIGAARRYFDGAGVTGPGVALLAVSNIFDAWILGIALRDLGLTTVIGRSADDLAALPLDGVLHGPRILVSPQAEDWPDLERAARAHGATIIRLPASAFAGAGAAPLEPSGPSPAGGHVLLTSGTTGVNKMVLIPAAYETTLNRRRQALFEIDAGSVVNLIDFGGWTGAGYKCAVAVWDARGAVILHHGAGKAVSFTADLTHAFAIPLALGEVLADPRLRPNANLRLFVTGGPTTGAMAAEIAARLTFHLHTHIGATETSTFAFTPILTDEDRRWHRIAAEREVQVVDDQDLPLPAGRVGALRVRRDEAVAGYLGDPETTAAFFREDWFYPGDLAELRADGRLALHGRVTDVINIDGAKIATGPIEETLREALAVSGACLFSLQNAAAEEELHVVLETAGPLGSEGQARLSDVLATAVPGAATVRLHLLAALPRNHMGKVERLKLRGLLSGRPDGD